MATVELTTHPELAFIVAVIRDGGTVDIVDHGRPVVRCVPPVRAFCDRLASLQARFTSPIYEGNEVVDMRREAAS
jgi:antitoxin (DNA-binding transcriptional repressor) of toxin-antitoxin stability system